MPNHGRDPLWIQFLVKLIKSSKQLSYRSQRLFLNISAWHPAFENIDDDPDLKIDVTLKDENGHTSLLRAVKEGNHRRIRSLLRREAKTNAQIDIPDNDGDTPLHHAVKMSDWQMIRILLGNGANPNIQNKQGTTPLHLACKIINIETTRLLLAGGANPNLREDGNVTPLHSIINATHTVPGDKTSTIVNILSRQGRKTILRMLLAHGADVDIRRDEDGKTAQEIAEDILKEYNVEIDYGKLVKIFKNWEIDGKPQLLLKQEQEKAERQQKKQAQQKELFAQSQTKTTKFTAELKNFLASETQNLQYLINIETDRAEGKTKSLSAIPKTPLSTQDQSPTKSPPKKLSAYQIKMKKLGEIPRELFSQENFTKNLLQKIKHFPLGNLQQFRKKTDHLFSFNFNKEGKSSDLVDLNLEDVKNFLLKIDAAITAEIDQTLGYFNSTDYQKDFKEYQKQQLEQKNDRLYVADLTDRIDRVRSELQKLEETEAQNRLSFSERQKKNLQNKKEELEKLTREFTSEAFRHRNHNIERLEGVLEPLRKKLNINSIPDIGPLSPDIDETEIARARKKFVIDSEIEKANKKAAAAKSERRMKQTSPASVTSPEENKTESDTPSFDSILPTDDRSSAASASSSFEISPTSSQRLDLNHRVAATALLGVRLFEIPRLEAGGGAALESPDWQKLFKESFNSDLETTITHENYKEVFHAHLNHLIEQILENQKHNKISYASNIPAIKSYIKSTLYGLFNHLSGDEAGRFDTRKGIAHMAGGRDQAHYQNGLRLINFMNHLISSQEMNLQNLAGTALDLEIGKKDYDLPIAELSRVLTLPTAAFEIKAPLQKAFIRINTHEQIIDFLANSKAIAKEGGELRVEEILTTIEDAFEQYSQTTSQNSNYQDFAERLITAKSMVAGNFTDFISGILSGNYLDENLIALDYLLGYPETPFSPTSGTVVPDSESSIQKAGNKLTCLFEEMAEKNYFTRTISQIDNLAQNIIKSDEILAANLKPYNILAESPATACASISQESLLSSSLEKSSARGGRH